jgi:hypothetical protein
VVQLIKKNPQQYTRHHKKAQQLTTSVLFTSHPQDGLVVNFYIPHNRRTPLEAEETLGPISIPRGSRGVYNDMKYITSTLL